MHAFLVVDMLNNSAKELANARKAIEKLAGPDDALPVSTSLVVLTEDGTRVSATSRNAKDVATKWEQFTRNVHVKDCTEAWNNAALGNPNIIVTSPDDVGDRSQYREQTAERITRCLN